MDDRELAQRLDNIENIVKQIQNYLNEHEMEETEEIENETKKFNFEVKK